MSRPCSTSAASGQRLTASTWRQTLAALGYQLKRLPQRGYPAFHDGKPVAVVHPKRMASELARLDRDGRPPRAYWRRTARNGARPVRHPRVRRPLRLFDVDSPRGTRQWLELDDALLDRERRPFLALLGPPFLAEGGFAALQEEALKFGVKLRARLDRTIRLEALPALAEGMEHWAKDRGLDLDDGFLRVKIDARVARAWGLTPDDLQVIYDDFTFNALPPFCRSHLSRRLEELI